MLLSQVVEASTAVGATRSRKAKTQVLAELLDAAPGAELGTVVAWLSGETTQGRIGIGYRTLASARVAPAGEPELSVQDVDAVLDEVSTTSGSGSVARRKALLESIFGRATESEQDFVVRLLTGEVRHGALEGVMTEAIASATGVPSAVVRRAVMLSGSLTATASAAVTGGEAALSAFSLEVGRPLRPMLASPAETLESAYADMGGEVSVEFKLDGARIQVHRRGREVHVYTRSLREITATVPELVELVLGLDCDSVVLDGETLALSDSGRPRSFQETMSRFGATSERELLLSPHFFDCMELDGVDLLDRPLSERLEALGRVAGPHRIPSLLRPTLEETEAHLDASLGSGHEGIMIKSLDSPYAAGRRGKSWRKVKPEHTLDLVVLGAEWGSGRRRGTLSNLHLGALDPETGEPVMVGKTFKGLTDELLRWQTEEFPKYERARDAWTVYMDPTLVVEIELDGAQVSSRYPGGVALRFARVLRYRPDKQAGDASTLDEIRALLPGG